MNAAFADVGYRIIPGFLSAEICAGILAAISDYRAQHHLPVIYRQAGERPLHYSVIDGECIRDHLPDVVTLAGEVNRLVNSITKQDLTLLADEKVAVNINITSKGGAYRWHYDRNAVTAILYLNETEGGETECYPNYRINLPARRFSRLQKISDQILQAPLLRRIFGCRVLVAPKTGTLLIMRGNECLHSVLPVTGETERVNVIISFDLPGKTFAVAAGLNQYLYHAAAASSTDPNYS